MVTGIRIEFPLDVHYGRMTEYIMAGLATRNLDAVKAKPAMLAVDLEDHAIHSENDMGDFRAPYLNTLSVRILKA